MQRKRFSIRSEIVLNLTFLAIISILLFSYVILRVTKTNLIEVERTRMQTTLAHLKESLATTLVKDDGNAEVLAKQLHQLPNYSLWDADQQLLIASGQVQAKVNPVVMQSMAETNVKEIIQYQRLLLWIEKVASVEYYLSVRHNDELLAVLHTNLDLAGIDAVLGKTKRLIFIYALLYSTLLALFAYFVLSKIIIAPIQRMVRAADRIAAGEIYERIAVENQDEIGRLAVAINTMTETLVENQTEIVRKEKLASVGRLAAGLAHEIGNPLGTLLGHVEILKTLDQAEKRQSLLERTERELLRIHKIIKELLGYARPDQLVVHRVELATLVREVVEGMADPKLLSSVKVQFEPKSDLFVQMDPDQLKQVVLNLIINACHAMHTEKREATLHLRSDLVATKKDERGKVIVDPLGREVDGVRLQVIDNGSGISAENLKRIFDPFYTTKEPGEGTGLGLYISASIIEAWGGSICVESTEGEGSCFSIILPRA